MVEIREAAQEEQKSGIRKKVVLLLGGSSFQGLTLLKQLAKTDNLVVVVNRGKNYWDNESTKIIAQNSTQITHCKADRKKESFTESVTQHIQNLGAIILTHVVDFSCYKIQDCDRVLSVIDQIRTNGLLSETKRLKYLFISTDSTYDSSGYLLDCHRHKFIPNGFMKAGQESKPKLPKNDKTRMYKQAYGAVIES